MLQFNKFSNNCPIILMSQTAINCLQILFGKQQNNQNNKMIESESPLSESRSFLPLDSSLKLSQPKPKIQRKVPKNNSVLLQQLRKIQNDDLRSKRECVIKYLKKEGEMKDTSELVRKIQEEGHVVPILQVAIAISKYDRKFLKELSDCKTIELREQEQSQTFQVNKKLQSDPILSLLSDSHSLGRVPKHQKEPSFLDFKQITPKRKNQLIDFERGKFRKVKTKSHSNIQFPQQLIKLKNQLLSLPYINRYERVLGLKNHQNFDYSSLSVQKEYQHISELNCSNRQSITLNSSKTNPFETNLSLEISLSRALEQRARNLSVSKGEVSLPSINLIKRSNLSRRLGSAQRQNKRAFDTIGSIDKSCQDSLRNSEKQLKINPEDNDQHPITKKRNGKSKTKQQSKLWPSYEKFSPYNKIYVSQIEKLKNKIRCLTELPQIPSEQTLNIYTSLKTLEYKDLKKLQKQSYEQEKNFSNTKYKIKYKNIKEKYAKQLKKYLKERKMQEFEMQQHQLLQESNFRTQQVKMNDKMLEKILIQNH